MTKEQSNGVRENLGRETVHHVAERFSGPAGADDHCAPGEQIFTTSTYPIPGIFALLDSIRQGETVFSRASEVLPTN